MYSTEYLSKKVVLSHFFFCFCTPPKLFYIVRVFAHIIDLIVYTFIDCKFPSA